MGRFRIFVLFVLPALVSASCGGGDGAASNADPVLRVMEGADHGADVISAGDSIIGLEFDVKAENRAIGIGSVRLDFFGSLNRRTAVDGVDLYRDNGKWDYTPGGGRRYG
ncbi:MAG: hypothetical protein CSA23_01865 [Deltaproteobacteria bacterium]|nr:MAG: hypothetical protein CSA23_01865 [Deltaproteobacteria bacterium]